MPDLPYRSTIESFGTLINGYRSGTLVAAPFHRRFVWSQAMVRDLMTKLYLGLPIGDFITAHPPTEGCGSLPAIRIIVDGKQRLDAVLTALFAVPVMTSDFKQIECRLAFNPANDAFDVSTISHRVNSEWLADISSVFAPDALPELLVEGYCHANPHCSPRRVALAFSRLYSILTLPVRVSEMAPGTPLTTLGDIFIARNT